MILVLCFQYENWDIGRIWIQSWISKAVNKLNFSLETISCHTDHIEITFWRLHFSLRITCWCRQNFSLSTSVLYHQQEGVFLSSFSSASKGKNIMSKSICSRISYTPNIILRITLITKWNKNFQSAIGSRAVSQNFRQKKGNSPRFYNWKVAMVNVFLSCFSLLRTKL